MVCRFLQVWLIYSNPIMWDEVDATRANCKAQWMLDFDVHPKQSITSFTIFFVFPHQLCVCKSFFNWSQICLNIHSLFLKNEMGVGRLTYGVNGLLSQFRGPPVKDSSPGQTNFKTYKSQLSHCCSKIAWNSNGHNSPWASATLTLATLAALLVNPYPHSS